MGAMVLNTVLKTAIQLHNMGLTVIPCKPQSKHYDVSAMAELGHTLASLKKRQPIIPYLLYWFDNDVGRNAALLTSDKYVVLDFDNLDAYTAFNDRYPAISSSLTIRTSRGYHIHYHLSNAITDPIIIDAPGVELKHSGASVLIPPSTHPNGTTYEVVGGYMLWNRFEVSKLWDVFDIPYVAKKDTEKDVAEKHSANFSFSWAGGASERSERSGGVAPIEDIKDNLSISQYLSSLGYTLKPIPDGRRITNCPFHKPDVHPSFWADDNVRLCNCYKPSCASIRPMDIIDLHKRLNGIDTRMAIRELGQFVGIPKRKSRRQRAFDYMNRNRT